MNVLRAGRRWNGYGFKLAILMALMVLFLIPQGLIVSLVHQRGQTQKAAIESMYQPLGGEVGLAGPFISLPATFLVRDSEGKENLVVKTVYLTPDASLLSMHANTEELQRGIYTAPVLDVLVSLDFRLDSAARLLDSLGALDADWSQAQLLIALSDARLLAGEASLSLTGTDSLAGRQRLVSAQSPLAQYGRGLAAPLGLPEDWQPVGAGLSGSFELRLRGGGGIQLLLAGGDAEVSLASAWPSPSFNGFILPRTRQLDDSGFSANWFMAESVQPLPRAFTADSNLRSSSQAVFGVAFIEPVDAYRKAYRAATYAFLFVAAPFLALFLFEVFTAIRVHPVQYCMIAFANMVFYVLLLSLSEHWGFNPAYGISALATSLLVGLYFRAVSRGHRSWPAGIGSMASLYALLYTILLSEDYALLIGAISLFALCGLVMWSTRRVDWYGGLSTAQTEDPTADDN